MTRRGFTAPIVLIGIILLVVILGGAYYLRKSNFQTTTTTPTPPVMAPVISSPIPSADPTTNWKTYRNDKYGFEIKYPGNLQSGNCPSKLAGFSCYNGASAFIGPLGLVIVTDSDPKRDKNGARFLFNGYFQGTKAKQPGFEECSISNIKNSSAAINYVYCPNRPIFTTQIKGGGIEIYLLGSIWNGPVLVGFTDQNQIDQTLSTFKFFR